MRPAAVDDAHPGLGGEADRPAQRHQAGPEQQRAALCGVHAGSAHGGGADDPLIVISLTSPTSFLGCGCCGLSRLGSKVRFCRRLLGRSR